MSILLRDQAQHLQVQVLCPHLKEMLPSFPDIKSWTDVRLKSCVSNLQHIPEVHALKVL